MIDEGARAWPFHEATVDLCPREPGVFFLYCMGRLIYIGVATSGSGVREELASHLRGAHAVGTRKATAFYGGRLPVCNESELSAC